jgi:hypothetical protein
LIAVTYAEENLNDYVCNVAFGDKDMAFGEIIRLYFSLHNGIMLFA